MIVAGWLRFCAGSTKITSSLPNTMTGWHQNLILYLATSAFGYCGYGTFSLFIKATCEPSAELANKLSISLQSPIVLQ